MNDLLLDGASRLRDFMDRHAVAGDVVAAPASAPTAQAAADLMGVPLACIAKTMLLTDGRRYVAAVLPGDRHLDRRKVAQVCGLSTLRLATSNEVREQTGFPPGGVAPIGFMRPMRVVVEQGLVEPGGEPLLAGGGREDLLLRITAAEIISLNEARVADICKEGRDGL